MGNYLSFRQRRTPLVLLAILCVIPGAFAYRLPSEARSVYVLVFSGVLSVSLFCQAVAYMGIVRLLPAIVGGRSHQRERYTAPEFIDLTLTMRLARPPNLFITTDPRITGPFTNAVTGTIRIPKPWLAKFSRREILSTIGHELGHVKHRKRYWTEMVGGFALALVAALILALQTVVLIAQVFELSIVFLVIPIISWRNERRADLASARALGPEGLISVLEQLRAESPADEGSETHPPLSDRIERLMDLLNDDGGRT